jgi:glutamate synthase (NADPH/NADH) small chain
MSDTQPPGANPKYAWHDLPRASVPKRPAAERLADFLEIYGPYDEQTAREQAARCIQCPDPQCVSACPLGNRIPEWLGLTAEGHFSEAAALLQSTSGLPEIAARACPSDRMCEGQCILNGKAEPVSIWAIEQFLSEYAFAHEEAVGPLAPPNGFRVAIVGAGPGGLTCADVLSRRGYAVTVFDWRLAPGGLLVSGTAAFRFERAIVERRIERLRQRGVEFQLGVVLGEHFTYWKLREGFDAVFLGFGARQPRELAVPGRDLRGVEQALVFLMQQQAEPHPGEAPIEVRGKRVVVLGGGDMAVDAVRTALRSGAREVVCVYRRDFENMPAIHSEYQNAVEEGAQFIFLAAAVALLGAESGDVAGVRLRRTQLGEVEPDGRKRVAFVPGTEFEIPAEVVLIALGFDPIPLPETDPFPALDRNAHGSLAVNEHQMTSLPGLFAGGDLVRGPSTVLHVVRDARKAAEGVDAYLRERRHRPETCGTPTCKAGVMPPAVP